MRNQLELAEAIQRTLADVKYNSQAVNFFFGRIKNVKYPFIDIYYPSFRESTASANMWNDISATVCIEFAYAKETEDEELYNFADSIIAPIKAGIKYMRGVKSLIITPDDDFEIRIVEGYLQILFNVNYQVDTAVKVAYDNLEKMQNLDVNIKKE